MRSIACPLRSTARLPQDGPGFDAAEWVATRTPTRTAGHDYGQYVRDADNAGLNDIAQFFRDTMKDDSARAARAHELLKNISGTDQAGPAAQ